MKDGYFAQDNGSSTQIEKLLEILIEQNEKQSEQIEQKDEIIRKLQKMLFGRKSEKAAALEMMANMEPLFDMDYPEPKQEERTGTVKAHERRRCPNRTDDLDSLPHEKVVIKADEEKDRTVVEVIPANIVIKDIYEEVFYSPTYRESSN